MSGQLLGDVPSRMRYIVAKAKLGLKRTCTDCGAKFYDLNRAPILCPKCGTQFVMTAAEKRAPDKASKDIDDTSDELEEAAPEIISLEDADVEVTGETDDIPDDVELDDVEVNTGLGEGDGPFLEDDDDNNDVSDIVIGPGKEDEET